MTSASEILEQRNVRRNRNLAILISMLLHAFLIGAMFFGRESGGHDTKQEVATLDRQAGQEKP